MTIPNILSDLSSNELEEISAAVKHEMLTTAENIMLNKNTYMEKENIVIVKNYFNFKTFLIILSLILFFLVIDFLY